MALGAAHGDQDDLAGRSVCRHLDPPLTWLRRLRQRGEIGRDIGRILGAELAFDESRHDAPRLARRELDLRGVEAAAGEIGPEAALPVEAVTVAAIGLPRRRVPSKPFPPPHRR